MILHPGILALLFGSAIVFSMLLYAGALGLKILARWNLQSSSEEQLLLERKSCLASTIVAWALGFEIVSVFLFIYTVDEIHPLFVGAMCATGSLNANPTGWYALLAKILLFFAAGIWLALNHLDAKAEDYPLTKRKFALLLLLLPLTGAECCLQIAYFLRLQPEVITSCCGSLFGGDSAGLAADLTALPVKPTMFVFYTAAALFLGSGLLGRKWIAPAGRFVFSLLAVLFFPVSIAAIVSFISLYLYAHPLHHCPFDFLQKGHGYVGYPLYIGLFGGTLFGLLPGTFQPLKKIPSLTNEIARIERIWMLLAVVLTGGFLLVATWPILFGHFRLLDYPGILE